MSAPLSFQSRVVVVTQPASWLTAFKLTVALLPSGLLPMALASFAICDPVAFPTVGVGHPLRDPPEALSDVGRADARSAKIGACNAIGCVL